MRAMTKKTLDLISEKVNKGDEKDNSDIFVEKFAF